MSVRVGDDQRNRLATVAPAPLGNRLVYNLRDIGFAGAGVLQQRAILSEEQIQEGLFVVGAAGFAQDIEIGIVSMHLPFRNRGTIRAARDPMRRQNSRLKPGAVGLRSLAWRNRGAEQRKGGEPSPRIQPSPVHAVPPSPHLQSVS